MLQANASETDKTVFISSDLVISLMPCLFQDLKNVTLKVEGTILQSLNHLQYPHGGNRGDNTSRSEEPYNALFHFEQCEDVTLGGNGTIEGQGFKWWVREFLGKNEYQRPYMVYFHLSRFVEVNDLLIRNAPYYHVVFDDCEFVSMQDAEIFVDIWGQLSLHQFFGTEYEMVNYGQYTLEVPIFPLNTDGIDIWAKNVNIKRVKVTNFDDAIVPKPSN